MLRVNSREVMPGDTFLALRGEIRDGHDYIEEAISKGASCIIAQEGEYSVKTIITKDTRAYLAKYLSELYADKLKKIELIAIAGTRGKTSAAYLTYNLLNSLNKKCAYIGSMGFYIDDKVREINNITPDLYELYELIIEAVNNECEYLVLEITNHALSQRRLEGLKFKFAALTNIGSPSKDYKASLEDYIEIETKLFEKLKRAGYAIINADDKYASKFILEKNQNILYGCKKSDYQISDITLFETHSIFNLNIDSYKQEIDLPLPCDYNIYNYLVAFIIASKIGVKEEEILLSTPYLTLPKGIYQVFEKNDTKVIVDNASLPHEVIDVVGYARTYTTGKIIVLIGSKGTTDKEFRSSLGKASIDISDYVIFTTDSPYKDNPETIIDDMTSELEKDNFEIVLDRKEAIKKGIGMLTPGDTLLVLGRGTEENQVIDNDKFPLSDINEVSKYMKK